jgi:hypothetical protein
MKNMALILIFLALSPVLFAQDSAVPTTKRPLNNIGINLLGNVSVVSANYERLFLVKPRFFFAGRAGVGFNKETFFIFDSPNHPPARHFTTFPFQLTANFGSGKSFFELGLGNTIILDSPEQSDYTYPIFGYRLQPKYSNNLNFRIYICIPLTQTDIILDIPIGISAGICF